MTEFLLAVGSFLAAHIVPAAPPVRRRIISVLGRAPYLVCYTILSIFLLGWVIHAAQSAQSPLLWAPAGWQWKIPAAFMPVALWMIIAGLLEPNALSISVRRAGNEQRAAIATVTRHPVLMGLLIWALGHIPPNGDLVSLILFCSMAALAVVGCFLLDRRKRREYGSAEWAVLARNTSIVPCLTAVSRSARLSWSRQMTYAVVIAGALYIWLILWGHKALFGVSPNLPEGLPLL